MAFRSRASYGKRVEFLAISELLRKGYDVYQTLVDDQGIDCIIRKEVDKLPIYIDLQIKARSKDASHARFTRLEIRESRPNYIFMFYSEYLNTYWIIPSSDIIHSIGWKLKSGKNKGKYSINLSGTEKGKPKKNLKYQKYENEGGFLILEKRIKDIANAYKKAYASK